MEHSFPKIRACQEDYRDTRGIFIILDFIVQNNEVLAVGYRENEHYSHKLETEPIKNLCILNN